MEDLINEMKCKVHSTLGQYMPQKPIKRVYKVWVHANDNGFLSECQIFTGKIGQAVLKNLGARVIYDLTKDLEEK